MQQELKLIRKNILKNSFLNKAGHIPSAFSIIEILYVLYNISMKKEDKFLLSKGHGCLGLYAILLQKNLITEEQFYSFSKYDSILGGHPDRNKNKNIEISAGSLGHGMPIAVGMSLSKKIKNERGRIYCLIGDGEANEGTTWESSIMADNLKLNNLICIVDNNNSQVRSLPTNQILKKFNSFGFNVYECDGHDLKQLEQSFNIESEKPICIIANTIKGYGIKEMVDNMHTWHHGPPNQEQYDKFIKELE
jgi:transketolase